ncbi:uncharacterized protein LOC132401913 isoform X2 [Hypanus sabinus]|uniref:uncharacterized protein LOC132401913 isoform X2 n=1 Tax=Hypanus sabinus TaxID=79690 RepID=UPI0028C47D75|nr:uncharacterized protein LOC132401913 isoform X2 [Hypanus sabinus]
MLLILKQLFLCILILEISQNLASVKKTNTDTGVDLFKTRSAAMFKIVSFDTPTGVVLAITFASKVKSNYQIDWKAVQKEHRERILSTDIEQCKDKLWCNAPTSPYNSVEVILQNLGENKKIIKMINIDPLKYRGYDPSVIKEKHGCGAHPCLNNGKCVLRPETSLGYVCICSPGYSGDFCQCAASTNKSASSALTTGCIVILLLLIALGYLIYLHFFRDRKHCPSDEKPTMDQQPHSRMPPRVHKPRVFRPKDRESPTQNDEQKNVRFQVEAARNDFEEDDESPKQSDVKLRKNHSLTDITKAIPRFSSAAGKKPPEDDNLSATEESNEEMARPTSGNSCPSGVQNGQAGIQNEAPSEYFVDSMPSTDHESNANQELPSSSRSDSIKSSILKEDNDFESTNSCRLPGNTWEMPSPMANEDLLDKKLHYLVSSGKQKSITDKKFQKGDLPTQKDFINEYCSEAPSQALLQYNHDCDTSSQSSDSSCSCAEQSAYCALNNISLQDNCDTLVFIPRRPTASNLQQECAEQGSSTEGSHVKEQKLVFPRHTKSGAVIYRLSDPEAEFKD